MVDNYIYGHKVSGTTECYLYDTALVEPFMTTYHSVPKCKDQFLHEYFIKTALIFRDVFDTY